MLLVVVLIAAGMAWFLPGWRADVREERVLHQVGRIGTVIHWGRYGHGKRLPFSLTLTPTLTTRSDSDLKAFAAF